MDWENLKTFVLASNAKSLSEAARSLDVSQPTLRRRISDLETELGVELIQRTATGFGLTKSGEKVRQFGLAMKEKADALIGNIPTDIDAEEGQIRLSGFPSFMSFHFAQYLPSLIQDYPGLRITTILDNDVSDPYLSEVDIAITHRKPDNPDLITRRIGSIHYMLFGSEAYLAENGAPETHFDIMSHRRGINQVYLTSGLIEREAGTVDFGRNIDWHFVCNSSELLARVCAGGVGLCPLPSSAIYFDPRLRPLPLAPITEVPIILVYTDRVRRLRRGQIVLDWLSSMMTGDRGYHFDSVLDVQRVVKDANEYQSDLLTS